MLVYLRIFGITNSVEHVCSATIVSFRIMSISVFIGHPTDIGVGGAGVNVVAEFMSIIRHYV